MRFLIKKILSPLYLLFLSYRRSLYQFFISKKSPFLFFLANLFHEELYTILTCWILSFLLLFRSRKRTLIVSWDYIFCNYKYGDFIFALTVAKLLSCFGFLVTFAEIHGSSSDDSSLDLTTVESSVLDFISQRQEILKWSKNIYPSINFWHGSPDEFASKFSSRDILIKYKPSYKRFVMVSYHNLITPLYLFLSNPQKTIFLDSLNASTPTNDLVDNSIFTNFRYNPTRPDKNNDCDYLVMLHKLAEEYNISIKVGTDHLGEAEVQKIMYSCNLNPSLLSCTKGSTYIQDFKSIHKSKLYIQYHGGGLAAILVSSSKHPYVIFQPYGAIAPWSRTKLFPFSNPNQIFAGSLNLSYFIKSITPFFSSL